MSNVDMNALAIMKYWMTERELIKVKKQQGHMKPWTTDPILQHFKFCNVDREDDSVTQWFKANWRSDQYWNEPNFVPAMMLGRTINWPATLSKIGFPFIWEPTKVKAIMDKIQAAGDKVYTGAYMITAGPTGVSKNEWVVGNAESYFINPPKIQRHSLQASWETIMDGKYPCVGPFIAGQIIADLKHTKFLTDAQDWYDWAPLGPGSMRGLHRLHGRPINVGLKQSQGLKEMREVRSLLKTDLDLQNVQNCLCEFDKYMRVKLGEGKPRSSYPGV